MEHYIKIWYNVNNSIALHVLSNTSVMTKKYETYHEIVV
ncbi:hypothetical protein [Yersinia phage fHe-Yen9-03]|uniref:Uncharacterized protein n=1 Tax=Yersinia phage fHe-Yen9-03 TaxID=2052743 RepID=A0A2C9D180_9CAUD|nr:hypothetical protein [Yersinia phage fHe-Yen9-03]